MIWAVFSFLAAYGAPFGTYGFSFNRRLLYWSLVVVISSLLARCFSRLASRLVRRFWQADGIVVLLMSVFFTPILQGLNLWLLPRGAPSVEMFLHLMTLVALISLGVVMTRRVIPALLLGGEYAAAPAPQPALLELPEPDPVKERLPDPAPPVEENPLPPRLMRRLSEGFHGPILRLCSEDHFVEVVSATDRERLRMRLADAIDEMDTVAGHSVHRSHWVTREAIEGVEREGARIFLRLSNGDRVPVSRTYKPKLEAAGIL